MLCWHCGLASHLAAAAVALNCCCFGAVFSKGCKARFQSSVRAHSWLVVAPVFLRHKYVRRESTPNLFKLHTVVFFLYFFLLNAIRWTCTTLCLSKCDFSRGPTWVHNSLSGHAPQWTALIVAKLLANRASLKNVGVRNLTPKRQ